MKANVDTPDLVKNEIKMMALNLVRENRLALCQLYW
jgi:hypothetical protein